MKILELTEKNGDTIFINFENVIAFKRKGNITRIETVIDGYNIQKVKEQPKEIFERLRQ